MTDTDDVIPTTDEAFSWRDQLAEADRLSQTLQGELYAARQAARRLYHQVQQHTGTGTDGQLDEADLVPLFEALRMQMRVKWI